MVSAGDDGANARMSKVGMPKCRLSYCQIQATRPPGALPKSSGRRRPALPLLPAPRATEVADSVRGARRRPLCGRACNASTRAWPERLGARPGEEARVGKRPDSADYGGAPRVSLAPSATGGAGRPAKYVGTVNADSALDTARRGAYINSSRSNARRRETAARRGRARDLENRILRSRDRRRRQTSEVESSLGMS